MFFPAMCKESEPRAPGSFIMGGTKSPVVVHSGGHQCARVVCSFAIIVVWHSPRGEIEIRIMSFLTLGERKNGRYELRGVLWGVLSQVQVRGVPPGNVARAPFFDIYFPSA